MTPTLHILQVLHVCHLNWQYSKQQELTQSQCLLKDVIRNSGFLLSIWLKMC